MGKQCLECGGEFTPESYQCRLCSDECRRRRQRRRLGSERYRECHQKWYRRRNPLTPRVCPACGRTFTPEGRVRRYCRDTNCVRARRTREQTASRKRRWERDPASKQRDLKRQRARDKLARSLAVLIVLLLFGCDPTAEISGPTPEEAHQEYVREEVRQAMGDGPTGGGPSIWQVCWEDCGGLICLDCSRGLCYPPPDGCEDLIRRLGIQEGGG